MATMEQRRPRNRDGRRLASLGPLVLSLALHVTLLLIAVAWLITPGDGSWRPGGDEVEVALLSEVELFERPDVSLDAMPEAPTPELTVDAPAITLTDPALTATVTDAMDLRDALSLGTGDPTGAAMEGLGGGMFGGGNASFFGAAARGKRFAYVVDRSGSMGESDKMRDTARELARSISELPPLAEYAVVLYNDSVSLLQGPLAWRQATRENKAELAAAALAVVPNGGTAPVPALRLVIQGLEPRPDAVFFLTDARFAEDLPPVIRQLNLRPPVPIHCIMFGSHADPADRDRDKRVMDQIAGDSGGSSVYRLVTP